MILAVLSATLALAGCGGSNAPGEVAMFRTRTGNPARYDVIVTAADGSEERVLTGDSVPHGVEPLLFGQLSWSPDGRRLCFAADLRRTHGGVGRTDIYVIDVRTRQLRRLTRSGRALAPTWSPDGHTLAFAQSVGGGSFPLTSSLWLIDVDGKRPQEILGPSTSTLDVPNTWSPDGSMLAFTRRRYLRSTGSVRSAIYIVRRDGSGLRAFARRASGAAWSPDGHKIAFASDRDNNGTFSYGDRTFMANELYVASIDGSDAVRLTQTRGLNEASPSWSPDGTEIMYQRGRVTQNAEATSVLRIDSAGGDSTVMAADPQLLTWYAAPSWAPAASR
jgi:Tol biopolymer transport system component